MTPTRRSFLLLGLAALAGCSKAPDAGSAAAMTPPPPTPLKKRDAPKAGRPR
ncbi:MAG TPA: hypothetical protein VM597_24800 [Gemmataceae bacterium]|jgi:hypothetical protein|nr:hypothetical protein [Gemmataceae bacterium]